MADYYFERECRTPYSECYTVLDGDTTVGRIDLHFAEGVVHATLTVAESLTSDNIEELINAAEEDLVDAVGITKEEMVVHVHQGRDLGVFSSHDFEGNGGFERMS